MAQSDTDYEYTWYANQVIDNLFLSSNTRIFVTVATVVGQGQVH